MSLFECIDMANEAIKRLDSSNGLTEKAYLFFSFQPEPEYNEKKEKESALFKKITERLLHEQELLEKSSRHYSRLEMLQYDLIPEIEAYLNNTSPIFRKQLDFILHELQLIHGAEGPAGFSREGNKRLGKYESSQYKVADILQSRSALGSSSGMCYGITSMMAIPYSSPYLNHRTEVRDRPYMPITRAVYEHQNNQIDEKADQTLLKKTRLTRKHFCPNKVRQAQEILAYAKAHPTKDLMLSLQQLNGAHACYLRFNITEGKQKEIWYMDPNWGAYRFAKEAEFIEFFTLSLENEKYTRYELSEMLYDPDNKLSRVPSLGDIWFALLTGRYYQYPDGLSGYRLFFLYLISSVAIVLAILETAFFLGTILFAPMTALSLVFITEIFLLIALGHVYQGILGPIQFFEECCYQIGCFISSCMGYSEEVELTKELDEVLESTDFSMA